MTPRSRRQVVHAAMLAFLLCLGQDPVSAQASAPVAASDDEYRLGSGDVLEIDVFGLEELDRRVRVSRDGSISLPLLGTFSISELTLQEAEERIAGMLSERKLVLDPQVSIFVEEFVSRAVSVQGAVEKPGVYQMMGRKTLLEMIGEAGGVSQDAGETILVLRGGAGEEPRRIEIDTERLTALGDLSLNIALRPNDIVMVPHARDFRVYVTGAVERPGAVEFPSNEGITVLQAITAAGGPTARANLKNVHLIRKLPDGTQERTRVNVRKIQNGKAEDVVLEKNDTLVVGEWFF